MRAPQLEQRLHAHLLAHFERLAVVLRGVVEADGGAVVARRRGDALAADLRHLVHVHLQLLHRRRAPRVVVVEKRVEGDGVLDGQPGVGDPLAEILERAAAGRVAVDFHDPRLDRVEAGLGRGVDDGDDVEIVAADGAGVQAVAERLVGRARARGRGPRRLRLTCVRTTPLRHRARRQRRARFLDGTSPFLAFLRPEGNGTDVVNATAGPRAGRRCLAAGFCGRCRCARLRAPNGMNRPTGCPLGQSPGWFRVPSAVSPDRRPVTAVHRGFRFPVLVVLATVDWRLATGDWR